MSLYIVDKLFGGTILLDLRGRITLGPETEALRSRVNNVLEGGHSRILLDLGGVDYIDSAGLSALIAAYTSTRRAGGELKLLHLTRTVRDVLQITKLSTVFELYDDLDTALASFGQASGASPA